MGEQSGELPDDPLKNLDSVNEWHPRNTGVSMAGVQLEHRALEPWCKWCTAHYHARGWGQTSWGGIME
jgi:hypothetical protein